MLNDRAIYEQTPAFLYAVDVSGHIQAVSDYWLAVMGYGRAAVMGQPWQAFLTPDSQVELTSGLPSECWETGSVRDLLLWFQPREGAAIAVKVAANLVRDEVGNPDYCVAVGVDVTEALATHSELEAYRNHLEQLISDRTEALSTTNHRLQQEIETRQAAEAQLRRSEADYRASFDHVAIGMAQVSLGGTFQRVNQTFCQQLGYAPESLLGLTFLDITHPEDREAHAPFMAQLLAGDLDYFSLEKRYLRQDSRVMWGQTTVSLVRDEAGRPLFFTVAVLDVSDRKATEMALRQSEERFRLIVEAIDDHFWIDDVVTGKPIYDSPRLQSVWGVTEAELQEGWDCLLEKVHPDDRTAFEHYLERINTQPHPASLEFRINHPSGGVKWLRSRSFPLLDAQGNLERVVGVATDITAQKQTLEALRQSEERFRLITETIEDHFWIDDAVTRQPIYDSPQLTPLWGITSAEIQDSLDSLIDKVHSEDRAAFDQYLETLYTHKKAASVEFRINHPSGEVKWLRSRSFPLLDAQGNLERVVGVTTNITKHKETELALQQYQRVVDASPDPICLIDPHYRLVLSNPAYQSLFSSEAVVPGASLRDIFTPTFFDTVTKERCDLALAGESQCYEEWLVNPFSDTEAFISIIYSPYYQADGTIAGVVNIIRDLTALKRTRDRLLATSERLRLHIENSPLAVIEWNSNLQVEQWSARATHLFGWPAAAVVGKHYREFPLVPETALPEMDAYAAELQTGKVRQQTVLTCNLTQSGEQRWCQWYNSTLVDEAGHLISILSLVQDVTEQQLAQVALQESEERWQLAIAGSNSGIWDWKITTHEVLYSPRWKEILGYADTELPNDPASWESRVNPEDLPRVKDLMHAHLRGETEFYVAEYRMRHKAGHEIWILSRGKAVFDAAGQAVRFVGSISDISDRKRMELELQSSQQLLQLVLDTMPQRVFWKDRNRVFLGCNRAFAQDMGYTSPADIIGRTDQELQSLTENCLELLAQRDRAVLEREEQIISEEQLQVYLDGTEQWVSTTQLPLKTDRGECIGIFCTYEDITDRRQAQLTLQRYAQMVEASNDGICLIDRAYRYLLTNPTYESWYGFNQSPIVGHTVAEVLGQVAFETRLRPIIDRCLAGETIRYADWFEFPHLGRRFRSVTLTPFVEESGAITGFVTSIRDLTALKESETRQQELLEIIEATPDFISIMTPDGQVVYRNPALERLLANPDSDRLSLDQIYAPWALELMQQVVLPTVRSEGIWQGESALLAEDGTEIPIAQTLTAHRNDRGEVTLISTIAHDISQRKDLENQLCELLQLEQVLSRLSSLFVNLSSDRLPTGMVAALRTVAQAIGADRAYLYLLSADQSQVTLHSQWQTTHLSPIPPDWQTIPTMPFPWWMAQLRSEEIVAINSLADLPPEAANERAVLASFGTQACAIVPLLHSETLLGYLGLSVIQPKAWRDNEISFLKLVGSLFANAYQRQQADEALRRQEHHFRALTERSSDLVVLLDEAGRFQYVSPSVTRLLGYEVADCLGHPAIAFVLPADIPAVLNTLHAAVAQPGVSQPLLQYRVRHRDGQWRYFEAVTTSLIEDPAVQAVVVNCRDVSDRVLAEKAQRHSEQSFKAVFEQSAISMAQIALDGTYIRVNRAFCDLVGYSEADLIGQHYALVTHPDDLDYDTRLSDEVVMGLVPSHRISKRFLRSDGSVRHVQVVVTAVQGEANSPAFLASVYNDVTDRIQLENSLRSVVEGTAAVVGDDFFPALAQHLAKNLGVDHLLINELLPNGRLVVLTHWSQGACQPCFSFRVEETPCQRTLEEGFFYCPAQLQAEFPQDHDLALFNADSYLGIALTSQAGDVIGEICALHHTQIPYSDNAIALLRIFAARASAELERQRSNRALQESESRWRRILQNMPVLLAAFDEDGIVTLWNQECERVTGYTAEEIVGNPNAFTLLYPDPDYLAHMLQLWKERKNNYRNWEWTVTCKDGSQKIIAWSNVSDQCPIPGLGTWGIGVDVTERCIAENALRESEARFQRLAANMPGIIYRYHSNVDGGDRFSYVSAGASTVWELEPEAIYADARIVWNLLFPEDIPAFEASMAKTLREGTQWFHEHRVRTPSGQVKWLQGVAKAERQPDNSYMWDGILIDVTARKQAELSYQESEARFQRLAANMPGIIYRYHSNAEGQDYFSYLSPACQEIWELSPEEGLADCKRVWQLLPEADRDRLAAAISTSQTQQTPLLEDYRIITPSGQVKWLKLLARPVLEEGGSCFWDGIVIDITQQKLTEQALKESEALNRAILNALPDLLMRIRRDGLCLDMQYPPHFPVVCPREQHVGRYIQDTLEPTAARDRLAATRRALETGTVQLYEYQIRIGGELRWEEARIVPLTADEVLVLVRDIDERKRAEQEVHRLNSVLEQQNEQLEALVEQRTAELLTFMNALPDQVFVVERETQRMPFVNEVTAKMAGKASRQELEGKTIFEIYPREQAAYYEQQNLQVFESGQVLHVQEVMETVDGIVHLDTYKIPLKHADGEVYALIGSSRDITELVRTRQQLEIQALQLEATNQELQSFSYSVSHDLRAPLRHINGFIAALKQHLEAIAPLDDRSLHYIEVISRSSHKMGMLIDGLLTLSRVGRRELVLRPVPLQPLVEHAISLLEDIPEDPSMLQITLDELPTVDGDSVLLQQVFVNLIENAVKFSRDRRPAQVHIGYRPGEDVFFIQDNGVGFDMAYADKLFSPFQRLHKQEEFKGTGIGLAIVKRIIHRHGGRIWAESAIDRGTTFFFTLKAEGEGDLVED